LFFFFFSSRRRHTRCLSDWSSDVCSSDLIANCLPGDRAGSVPPGTSGKSLPLFQPPGPGQRSCGEERLQNPWHRCCGGSDQALRSEERRVGKECRAAWEGYLCRKKKDVMR